LSDNPKYLESFLSPDQNATGFLRNSPDPLRYDGHVMDSDEVSGIVAGMVPIGARVLDIGCGTGSLGQILTDVRHAEVVGVEPDPARAQRAMERNLEVHTGYLTRELLREIGLFDVVLFADVLEHLPNPQPMLALSREAIRAGGAVVVSVPNVAHWSVRVDIIRGKFRYQSCGIMDATHLRWFTRESINSLVESAGFKVTHYRATAGLLLSDNVLRRPLRWLPEKWRTRLLRTACLHWPTLFGCQYVLRAELDEYDRRHSREFNG